MLLGIINKRGKQSNAFTKVTQVKNRRIDRINTNRQELLAGNPMNSCNESQLPNIEKRARSNTKMSYNPMSTTNKFSKC